METLVVLLKWTEVGGGGERLPSSRIHSRVFSHV